MSKVVVRVQVVDEATYREFKALAVERGMRLGDALTIAMRRFLKGQAVNSRSPSRVHHSDGVELFSFGAGTEDLSELMS